MNKLTTFVKESIEELKRVQWPNKQDTTCLTAYVIGVSLGVGLLVTSLDYVFKELLSYILKI